MILRALKGPKFYFLVLLTSLNCLSTTCTFPLLKTCPQASDSLPRDIPLEFVLSLVNHSSCHCDDTSGVYPLRAEEFTMWLIKDTNLSFLFLNLTTGKMELSTLSSRFERPNFARLFRCVKRACVWLFSQIDGADSVVFHDRNKVDLHMCRPAGGLFVRLSGRTVSQCQTLLKSFTSSRPSRRTCDLARPARGIFIAKAALPQLCCLDRSGRFGRRGLALTLAKPDEQAKLRDLVPELQPLKAIDPATYTSEC